MKTLITATDVKKVAENHETTFYIQADSIITPSATDTAQDLGIQIIVGSAPEPVQDEINTPCNPIALPSSGLDPNLVAKIVGEVMACLNLSKQPSQLIKEVDPCGLRLAKGDSVVLENYDTGNPQDKVKIKELFNSRESSNFSAGFISLEATSYSTLIKHDELNYIIDGTLKCNVNGKTYIGKPGDTFFIPANTKVTFSTSNNVRFFYASSLNR
ncbi:cupin domain-containing protein [Desulfosporosinus sp.]|uniref:cupin domain-containing protein n=1 Tax=Desulfosporosinus sp. TaxID=157907 RepID=UPI0025C30B99|nr:cupin domain-containing protein [Desulfosporosinus sp.]MBC2722547.1 cupin domain-containing protein [Desulfosporosinus sp.]MBC2728160.1 cupin domain-containing protein [Desulfosporosinus sp.]